MDITTLETLRKLHKADKALAAATSAAARAHWQRERSRHVEAVSNVRIAHLPDITGLRIQADDLPKITVPLTITMPCGNVAHYEPGSYPTVDVRCPCGDSTHWLVRIISA